MIKTASSSLGQSTRQGLIRCGIWGVFLFCLVPVLSVAADPVVEMPPMPGQVYHAQDQPASEEKKTELPPELQQLDEQINQDAAILSGGQPAASDGGTHPAVGTAAPLSQQAAPAANNKTEAVKATKSSAGSSNAALIALVAAVGAAAVFVLRRRGGQRPS